MDTTTTKRPLWSTGAPLAAILPMAVAGLIAVAGPVAKGSPASATPLAVGGPCIQTSFVLPHPTQASENITVFEPSGTGTAEIGGTCGDGSRPTVLFAHGYTARHPAAYGALISHLVSRGFAVFYPTYPNSGTTATWTEMEDAAFQAAFAATPRADRNRIGIVGHSMGGGLTPRLVQLAGTHGWGTAAFFAAPMAPFFAANVGAGPIEVPDHMRWLTIVFESDDVLDNGIGTEAYRGIDLPSSQKAFMTVLNDPTRSLIANHMVPVGVATDDMDIYGVWRPIDALARCALLSIDCDFAYADAQVGTVMHPANIVTDDPIDANVPLPNAIPKTECTGLLNPRPCPSHPWVTTLRYNQAVAGGTTPPQQLFFGDQQSPTGQLTVTTASGDAELLPPANVTATPVGEGQVSVTAKGAPGMIGRTTASVTITDPNGNAATRSFVATFGGSAPKTGGYHPILPQRILDTRFGVGTEGGRVGETGSIELQVTGRVGIPASGVTGVVLNVTAENPTATGFVTVSPTGDPRAVTSNLNTTPGDTRPNLVEARVGAAGKVTLFNNSGSTHLIADVAGWIDDGRASTASGRSQFGPLSPTRILDTRGSVAPATRASGFGAPTSIGAGDTIDLPVDVGCSPISDTPTAVAMNVTATNATSASHLTVWPSGDPVPTVSNLNFVTGKTVPNMAIVAIGTGQSISIRNNSGTVDVIVDLAGCFFADDDNISGRVVAASPARLADTRFGIGTAVGALGAGAARTIQVTGRAGVPSTGVQAVIVNLTGTEPTDATHLTAWPDGELQPLASNVNLEPGQTAPNLAVVKLSPTGAISVSNNSGSTHVVIDVAGWVLA